MPGSRYRAVCVPAARTDRVAAAGKLARALMRARLGLLSLQNGKPQTRPTSKLPHRCLKCVCHKKVDDESLYGCACLPASGAIPMQRSARQPASRRRFQALAVGNCNRWLENFKLSERPHRPLKACRQRLKFVVTFGTVCSPPTYCSSALQHLNFRPVVQTSIAWTGSASVVRRTIMKWLDIGAVMAAWIASCVAAGWLISAAAFLA